MGLLQAKRLSRNWKRKTWTTWVRTTAVLMTSLHQHANIPDYPSTRTHAHTNTHTRVKKSSCLLSHELFIFVASIACPETDSWFQPASSSRVSRDAPTKHTSKSKSKSSSPKVLFVRGGTPLPLKACQQLKTVFFGVSAFMLCDYGKDSFVLRPIVSMNGKTCMLRDFENVRIT